MPDTHQSDAARHPGFSAMCRRALVLSGLVLALQSPAWASLDGTAQKTMAPATAAPANIAGYGTHFADYQRFRIDYSFIDSFLSHTVLNTGLSERRSEVRSLQTMGVFPGSRLLYGHYGRAALEGNRVPYSLFTKNIRNDVSRMRRYFEKLSYAMDFSAMTDDQQLAYWFNLHNVVVLDQIAHHYPVSHPEDLRVGLGHELLSDAKIINIRGGPLSLRDIREKIVYAHWHDPRVFYGFFRGTVGGPNIRAKAYRPQTVWKQLDSSAREFVNSFRGVDRSRRILYVSSYYRELQQAMGLDEVALRAHLQRFAVPAVAGILQYSLPLRYGPKYGRVADLSGGQSDAPTLSLLELLNGASLFAEGGIPGALGPEQRRLLDGPNGLTPQAQLFLVRLFEKNTRLLRRGYTPTVIVGEDRYDDEPSSGQAQDGTEDRPEN